MKISEDKLKQIYLTMKRCRAFDYRVREEYMKGRMAGWAHLSVGQEAVSAGICCMLREDDYVLGSHRGHASTVAKGAKYDRLMAELFGREAGYSKGKAGSLHLHAVEHGVLLCSGMVGSQIPIASGVALGCKKKNWDRVVACFFGDGATNTSAFHEGVVMAAAYGLPVLLVCENNQYAVSAYWRDFIKLESIADRAKGYGISGISVDGMNAIAVAEVAAEAINKLRKGGGPILIEANCYRYFGQSTQIDRTETRMLEEIEEWKKRDPIKAMYCTLSESGLITEKENLEIDTKLAEELDQAVEFALQSPEPRTEEALMDLYC